MTHDHDEAGYDDSSELHPTTDFDYSEIDRRLNISKRIEAAEKLQPEKRRIALEKIGIEIEREAIRASAQVIGCEDRETVFDEMTEEEWKCAWRGVGNVVKWVYQRNSRNFQGIGIRALIVCWVWIPGLHGLTLTQLAGRFKMAKQSIGRWVVDWKLRFPHCVSVHMHSEIAQLYQEFEEEELAA